MFTIKNADTEIAYGVVRMSKIQFEAVKEFMHSQSNIVKFPGLVTLVAQGSGYYRLLPNFGDPKSTERVKGAMKLIGRAIKDFQADVAADIRRVQHMKTTGAQTVAYVGDKNWNTGNYQTVHRPAAHQPKKPRPIVQTDINKLASRFRVKGVYA
ncbi:hypothetical protein [Achromobacter phage Motura]|uniref:Uncharacterized protein n=1 Tax=Achromobacter phage Motura TaxID=2591403 RepID=A0A514CSK9_9CAUD|nr:hypothetical protein H1O15_gp045 [Achromobacter phage Motura]QDH83453.1 hypothetical protein [Achromobacter phage Motura]